MLSQDRLVYFVNSDLRPFSNTTLWSIPNSQDGIHSRARSQNQTLSEEFPREWLELFTSSKSLKHPFVLMITGWLRDSAGEGLWKQNCYFFPPHANGFNIKLLPWGLESQSIIHVFRPSTDGLCSSHCICTTCVATFEIHLRELRSIFSEVDIVLYWLDWSQRAKRDDWW